MTDNEHSSQAQLLSSILDKGLCTGCGACTQLCPYLKTHKAETIAVFECNRQTGRCFQYCPRTKPPTADLTNALFDPLDLTEELGAFKGLYMTRASDPGIREKAQHGGTVTALLSFALDIGLINACVVADQDEHMLPESITVFNPSGVLSAAGSKFGNAPTVGEFNRISSQGDHQIAVVATPCQALALGKMRAFPAKEDKNRMNRLKLVIGLFCGWTLDWRQLNLLVRRAVGSQNILALDIPPSGHACMQVTTPRGVLEIPIDQVNACVRSCCEYCTDMTAEFADISVGSARSKDGWEVDRYWNQTIVRSRAGEKFIDLAREKGVLEFKAVLPENLVKLKTASASKKSKGQSRLNTLTQTGNPGRSHTLDRK